MAYHVVWVENGKKQVFSARSYRQADAMARTLESLGIWYHMFQGVYAQVR